MSYYKKYKRYKSDSNFLSNHMKNHLHSSIPITKVYSLEPMNVYNIESLRVSFMMSLL